MTRRATIQKQQQPNGNRSRQKIIAGRPNYAYQNGHTQEGEVNTNHEIYVSARGHQIVFLPMPPMLKETIEAGLQSEWPKPQPTTYRVETVTGEKETHTHTEKTEKSPDEQEEWDAYQLESVRWEAENWSRFLRALQIECIRFDEKEGWERKQKFLKMNIPEDEFERQLHYIQTEIVGDPDDVMACFIIPLRLSGAPDQQLAAVENSFRTAIRSQGFRKAPQTSNAE